MNTPESASKSTYGSCKRQENGDSTKETERPLKKARFAWQVKGKYHLKNELSDKQSSLAGEAGNAGSSSKNVTECKELLPYTQANVEISSDYLLEQDLCTLDSINDRDQSFVPSISVSKEKLPYPEFISSSISDSKKDVLNYISPSMVTCKDYLEDHCIARWQSRQMAKCFVDNTINSLIDNCMRGPLHTDIDEDRFTVFEPLNISNNNNIENEGILMAISAHGLQNTSTSSSNTSIEISTPSKDVFLSPPSSPYSENMDDINSIGSNELNKSLADNLIQNNIQEPLSPEIISYSYQSYNQTDDLPPLTPYNIEYESDNNNFLIDNDTSHFDFLDTAVSFAIQYKGLTSYGTDYG